MSASDKSVRKGFIVRLSSSFVSFNLASFDFVSLGVGVSVATVFMALPACGQNAPAPAPRSPMPQAAPAPQTTMPRPPGPQTSPTPTPQGQNIRGQNTPAGTGAQTPPIAATNAQTFSLTDALNLAQSRSFVSQQYDARVAGAAARITSAGALLNPVFSIGAHVGKNTGGTDEDYLISETFELGDKSRQRLRAARADREAATLDRQQARNDLVFNVQSAYFEAQRAEAERGLALNALDNARKFAETAQLQFTAGDVARSQVVRSRIEQNRAEQALTVADTERANRLAALRSLARMQDGTAFTLDGALPFAPRTYSLPDLETYALSRRPDLLSARRTRDSKEALLHGARAQSQPDLFVEARHGNIDVTQGGNSARAGLLFPLADFGRGRSDVTVAKAVLTEQDAIIAESRRMALLDVDTAFRNLEQARRTVESFQGGRLDSSRELLDMAQVGYAQGANTFLELLDAQQVYRTEQTDYTRALAAYNIALAALQRAVGGTLP